MHDLIQDMGREIVRQEAPNPDERSRLCAPSTLDYLSPTSLYSPFPTGVRLLPSGHRPHRCQIHSRVPRSLASHSNPQSRTSFACLDSSSFDNPVEAAKGIRGIEVVMPQTEIPEWFDFVGNGGNPRFWTRGKFPVFALALVFQDVRGRLRPSRRQLVELHLVINGRCVPRKGYYNFRIAADHVLICDLRLLFSDEEWLGLDAFLEHEWNLVQVSYEAPSTLTLSGWGVFVYEEGANMEDVQFMCPDPKYSNMSPTVVPKKDPKQERKKMIEESCLDEMFGGMLIEPPEYYEKRKDLAGKDVEELYSLISFLKKMSSQAKYELESAGSTLEDKNSLLTSFLDAVNIRQTEGAWPENLYHKGRLKDEVKAPMEVGEGSSSGDRGSKGKQGNDPQREEAIMWGIIYDGMMDGLYEARNRFPSLDIIKTRSAVLNKGIRPIELSPVGKLVLPTDEMRTYTTGIVNGLLEAKLSFPDLDMWATLNAALSRIGIEASFAPPPTGLQDSLNNEEADPENLFHKDRLKDEVKAPMEVGEGSSSGHQGSEKQQSYDPQQEEE
ncbi:TMV resistance protein N [Spatholobus suberectus]|nr:TMV resistance protein N [Spatholobus suberectus]